MKFSNWIKNLEKRKIVTIKPHPIIPFILGLIILGLTIYGRTFGNKYLNYFLYFLTIFTFIFAIGHFIVVLIVRKKNK